jgi:hypothetical protein
LTCQQLANDGSSQESSKEPSPSTFRLQISNDVMVLPQQAGQHMNFAAIVALCLTDHNEYRWQLQQHCCCWKQQKQ